LLKTLPLANRLFRSSPSPSTLVRPLFGGKIPLDVSRSNAQRLLYLLGDSFVAERHLLRRLVGTGSRVVDVGANIGYYLLLWEECIGPAGHVECVEPDPSNLRDLTLTVELNGLTNVNVIAAAAGAYDGDARLQEGINATVVTYGGCVSVPMRKLDSLIAGAVDLVKIDVEGYEGEVLAGAMALLSKERPTLFLELHPWLLSAGHTVQSIWETLQGLYRRLEMWDVERARGFRMLAQRYGLVSSLRHVGVFDRELAERYAHREEPCWVVGLA
jgi:FkbM family methyltransferase